MQLKKGERDRPGRTSRRPADWPDGGERFAKKLSSSAPDDLDHTVEDTGRDARTLETAAWFRLRLELREPSPKR